MRKIVLVTGASRGLGRAICEVFARNNYDIIANYKVNNASALSLKEELESKYKVKVFLVKADISKEDAVCKMFTDISSNFAKIDVLINNAGIAMDNDLKSKTSSEFSQVLNVNLLGTYLVTKYALKLLSSGSIINVTSTNGIDTGYIEGVDYDASKAGVIALTHDFARALAPNIRVNAVAPGWINTDMNKDINPEFKSCEENKILLKRFGNPEEIANVIYFLASLEASYINDTIIRIDGGRNV